MIVLVFLMYCDIRMYDDILRVQLIEFAHLADFHKDFINQHDCTTWEQYVEAIEQYNNKNKGRCISVYLNRCKTIPPNRLNIFQGSAITEQSD
jgi:hypothetical protein